MRGRTRFLPDMAGLHATILMLWAGIVLAKSTGSPPPPQCFYQVTPILGGFQIDMINTTDGNYTIAITEKKQTVKLDKIIVYNHKSTLELKHLKPCTEYELSVVSADGRMTCNSDDKTETQRMVGDITEVNKEPGYVCYHSDWNIVSALSPPNNRFQQRENGKFCFRLDDGDFCSDLNKTFTLENCTENFSLPTRYISVDFIDPRDIIQHKPTGLPAKIETKLPSNCENFTVDYTCSESGNINQFIDISDLEPFTEYSCTGLIHQNYVSIKTPPFQFQIDCDLTITIIQTHGTNTSTELAWKTTSKNCGDVLQNLTKLSYRPTCSCQITSFTPDGGTCKRTGLKPYADYSCEVQPTYSNRKVSKSETFRWRTEAGTPEPVTDLQETNPGNNEIRITCSHQRDKFHGPKKIYIARLGGHEQCKTTCEFVFKDLSYLTTYTVEVVAFNGELKSKPVTKQVRTSYIFVAAPPFIRLILSIACIIGLAVALSVIYRKMKQGKPKKDANKWLKPQQRLVEEQRN